MTARAIESGHTPRRREAGAVFALAAPVAAGLIVQNGMSLISLGVIGRFGDAALAGMGVASAVVGVLLAVLFGLDTGVQVLTAQRLGAGDAKGAGAVLTQGLIISGAAGVALTLLAWLAGPPIVRLILRDPMAARAGCDLITGVAPLLLALAGNMAFSAYWNGAGAPVWPFAITLVQTPVHLALNLALGLGFAGLPALGPFGAGLGSSLAALFALGLHVVLATRLRPVIGLAFRRPDAELIRSFFAIGAPVSLQGATLGVGVAAYVAVIARVGVAALATVNVIQTLMLVFTSLATGFGAAAITRVGYSLGRRDVDEAGRRGWETALIVGMVTGALALPLAIAPQVVAGPFIHTAATLSAAAAPLRISALSITLDAVALALAYALRGASATRAASAASVLLEWGFQIPLSWLVGVQMGFGLIGVAWVDLVRALIQTAAMAIIWRRRLASISRLA